MNEWISVKDRLPIDNERYLTIDPYKIISIDHFMPFDNSFIRTAITHWMPLPALPDNI